MKRLEGPIGVISVAGMYRSGKSYLLNRVLLNQSRGFDVGHTINACTKVRKAVMFLGRRMSELRKGEDEVLLIIGALNVTYLLKNSCLDPAIRARFLSCYRIWNSFKKVSNRLINC